jgi:hypothetical protein
MTPAQREALATPAGFGRHVLGFNLYPKQEAILDAVWRPGSRVAFKAGNETGKTSIIGTTLVLHHLSVFPGGQVVSTAGAWRQVVGQLVPNLARFAHMFPEWKFNTSEIVVKGTPRYIGFSTNDAGKFEGYHDLPSGPLLIIADEAKTIDGKVFQAMDRCNPCRQIIMSSPGTAEGEFYAAFTKKAAAYTRFSLPQTECPHISKESIERAEAKWGKDHPLVRSMVYAEFMESVEDAIVALSHWEQCIQNPPNFAAGERHAFCDFAAGGDENVLALRTGNKVELIDCWRDSNEMSAIARFIRSFRKHGLKPSDISGDASGLGHTVISRMAELGWPINKVFNQSAPLVDPHYFNRISEMWHEGARQIRDKQVIMPEDGDLQGQVISRKLKYHSNGKIWAESKEDMKKRGLPSPDRADAVFGAMSPLPMGARNVFDPVPGGYQRDWMDGPEQVEVDERLLAGFQV